MKNILVALGTLGLSLVSASTAAHAGRNIASALDAIIANSTVCMLDLHTQSPQQVSLPLCSLNPDLTSNCPTPTPSPTPLNFNLFNPRFTCDGGEWQTLTRITSANTYDSYGPEATGQLKLFLSKGFRVVSSLNTDLYTLSK